MQLSNDATETPYIYLAVVFLPQNDLRGPVVPTLDVSVNRLILKAARAEVYDFNSGFIGFFQEDVLRLEISVNNIV